MKNEQNKKSKEESGGSGTPVRGKTNVKGQNPKQNDSPDHDEHHDESRINVATKERSSSGKS